MRVRDRRAARPALEIGVHHLSRDGAGPDDGHLDHQVVEALGLHARKRRHLRAALDLEDAHRVGALDHGVGRRVVGREPGQVDGDALVLAHQVDRVLQGAEQMGLKQGAVLTRLHRARLKLKDLVQSEDALP